MICLLCLTANKHLIELFQGKGVERNIRKIVSQHFSLEAKEDDPSGSSICLSCWHKLDAFHTFYLEIIEVQKSRAASDLLAVTKLETEIYEGDFAHDDLAGLELKTFLEENQQEQEFHAELVKLEEPTIEDPIEIEGCFEPDEMTLGSVKYSNKKSEDPTEARTAVRKATKRTVKALEPEILTGVRDDLESTESDDNFTAPTEESTSTSTTDGEWQETKNGVKKKRCNSPATLNKMAERRERNKEEDALLAQHSKLNCDTCEVVLTTFTGLMKHIRKQHNKKGYVVCCDKKFDSRGQLAEHVRFHLNPELYKCQECGKVFTTKRGLGNHEKLVHNADKYKTLQCDECPEKFLNASNLKMHKLSHIPEAERSFACDLCGKRFYAAFMLKDHQDRVHANRCVEICDICGKTFKTKKGMKHHKRQHDGTMPKFKCEQCGKELTRADSLKRHMEEMHTETAYVGVCKFCGKTATNPRALIRHLNYMHKCERRHKCTICEKAFKKEYQLKEHMCVHTGAYLYKCPHCPKVFSSNATLHGHRKKAHRTEWEQNRRNVRSCIGPGPEPVVSSITSLNNIV